MTAPARLSSGTSHQATSPVPGSDSATRNPPTTIASQRQRAGVAAAPTMVSRIAAAGTCQLVTVTRAAYWARSACQAAGVTAARTVATAVSTAPSRTRPA